MTRLRVNTVVALCFAITLTLAGCTSPAEPPTATAPVGPPVPPLLSTNAMMVGLVDDASHKIWDAAVKGSEPKTDEDWYHLQHYATQVALSGTLITIPGTGEADAAWVVKPDWIKFSRELADGGVAALEAAQRKDLNALSAAGDRIVTTCEGCHKTFKGDLPSEGILHQREVH